MSVRSEPTYNGRTLAEERALRIEQEAAAAARARRNDARLLGGVLVVFGLLWWLPVARTTVDGWVIGLNVLAEFFKLPGQITRPTGWLLLGLAVVVGFVYSRVEIHNSPVKYGWSKRKNKNIVVLAPLMAWVGWLFLAVTDVGSTYVGIISPPQDAWAIHDQLAGIPWLAFALALLSTYAPDLITFAGWRLVRGRPLIKPTPDTED